AAAGWGASHMRAFSPHSLQVIADRTAPQIFGVAQAYDALYTLAFAEAATTKATPLGLDLDQALHLVLTPRDSSPPAAIDIGPGGLPAAFAAITAGKPLSLNGASAPLA